MRFVFLCAVLWGGSSSAYAILTASLNRTKGTMDDRFILTVEVMGDADGRPSPGPVAGLGFQKFNESQTSRYDILRGHSETQITYQYYVEVSKAGDYTIPAIKMKIDGKWEETVPLKFSVAAAKATTRDEAPQVFVERELDKSKLYRGETIRSRLKIYMRVNVREAENATELGNQFEVLRSKTPKRYQTTVSGYQYNVQEITEVIKPLRAGKLTLAPVVLRIVTEEPRQRRRRRSPLDFFGSDARLRRQVVRSKSDEIEVMPLPKAGRPQNFSGLVGSFELQGEISQADAKVGDNVTLSLTLEGRGSVDEVDELKVTWPDGLKVYPDKPEGESGIDYEAGLVGRKVFKFALVPTKPGRYELKSLSLPVFSPNLKQYVELAVDLPPLVVTGEANELVTNASDKKARVKVLDVDIIGLKRSGLRGSDELGSSEIIGLAFLSSAPGFVFLGLFVVGLTRRKNPASESRKRRSKAASQLRKRLDGVEDIEEIANSFRNYFGDRFARHGNALTVKEILALLSSHGIAESVSHEVNDILETCSAASYGMAGDGNTEIAALRQRILSCVGEVEKHV